MVGEVVRCQGSYSGLASPRILVLLLGWISCFEKVGEDAGEADHADQLIEEKDIQGALPGGGRGVGVHTGEIIPLEKGNLVRCLVLLVIFIILWLGSL